MTDTIDLASVDDALALAAPQLDRTGFRDDQGHVVGVSGLAVVDMSHRLRIQDKATFCHYVLHFTGPDTAQQWTAAHPGTFVLSLDAAVELAHRHTDRCFGEASR